MPVGKGEQGGGWRCSPPGYPLAPLQIAAPQLVGENPPVQGSALRHCQRQDFLFFRKEIVTLKKERLCTILFLMTLAALGEYWHAVSGGTEARAASFSMRERRWSLPNIAPLEVRRVGPSSLAVRRCSLHAGETGRSCGAHRMPGKQGFAEPRGPRQESLLGAAASLCTPSPCPQPASWHPDVGGDHVTTGTVRNSSQVTLCR